MNEDVTPSLTKSVASLTDGMDKSHGLNSLSYLPGLSDKSFFIHMVSVFHQHSINKEVVWEMHKLDALVEHR